MEEICEMVRYDGSEAKRVTKIPGGYSWGPRTAWLAQLSAAHIHTHSIAVQFLAQLSCSAMSMIMSCT